MRSTARTVDGKSFLLIFAGARVMEILERADTAQISQCSYDLKCGSRRIEALCRAVHKDTAGFIFFTREPLPVIHNGIRIIGRIAVIHKNIPCGFVHDKYGAMVGSERIARGLLEGSIQCRNDIIAGFVFLEKFRGDLLLQIRMRSQQPAVLRLLQPAGAIIEITDRMCVQRSIRIISRLIALTVQCGLCKDSLSVCSQNTAADDLLRKCFCPLIIGTVQQFCTHCCLKIHHIADQTDKQKDRQNRYDPVRPQRLLLLFFGRELSS